MASYTRGPYPQELQSVSKTASNIRGSIPQETQSVLNPNVATYAGVTANPLFPSKGQAVILDSIDGCSIDNYLDGIKKITESFTLTTLLSWINLLVPKCQ